MKRQAFYWSATISSMLNRTADDTIRAASSWSYLSTESSAAIGFIEVSYVSENEPNIYIGETCFSIIWHKNISKVSHALNLVAKKDGGGFYRNFKSQSMLRRGIARSGKLSKVEEFVLRIIIKQERCQCRLPLPQVEKVLGTQKLHVGIDAGFRVARIDQGQLSKANESLVVRNFVHRACVVLQWRTFTSYWRSFHP